MTYRPPFYLRNGHIQSIYPSLFRNPPSANISTTTIATPDADFLTLDWYLRGHKRLAILSHGLEGHSRRPYITGMANYLTEHQWDCLAWNFRGCGDAPNNHPYSYHSGKTEDLSLVINEAISQGYQEIALIGFSIGGNKTLLHLGRESALIPKEVIASVTFSVPCDLTASSKHLAQRSHRLYMSNFLKSFEAKLAEKQIRFPEQISLVDFHKIKTFKQFDERYTAPLNGFKSAEEYWQLSSCLPYLTYIKVPSLLVSAQDDPFLPPECYPIEFVAKHSLIKLDMPKFGGHVGFMPEKRSTPYYSERRALQFINQFSQQNP